VLVSGLERGPFGGPGRRADPHVMRKASGWIARAMLAALVISTVPCAGSGCSAAPIGKPNPASAGSVANEPGVRTVKLPYRGYGMARVVGENLYVTVDSGTGLIDTLLRYDLRSGESRRMFTVAADIAWITVNERWLLWESEKRLYAEPVGGGPKRVLATSREAYGPALEGDVAAWVDHEEGSEPRIVTFDLTSGEKREIARTHVAEFYNNFMQITGGRLLWTDIYDGTGHYVVHDLARATTRDYPMPATRFRYPGYASMSGGAIFSINFDRYDQWDWGTQQVGRFSLATRAFTPITKGGEFVNALAVGRDGIAIIDSEQRLLVGPSDGTRRVKDLSAALGTRVDGVQVSSDGATAVAGRSVPERAETLLFVFRLR
jgi:hypothetical protein